MRKAESVLENEMQKILRDFDIETVHPNQARQAEQVQINKKKHNLEILPI